MKKSEVIQLIGKMVCFSSNRTRPWIQPTQWGEVQEVKGSEARIADDWHDLNTLEIHKVEDE